MGKNMQFHGCDVALLTEDYGTPLYLMSEDAIRERCREIRESFILKYENTRAVYASKAFQTMDMCRIVKSEGLGVDVVSAGEIYAALRAGTDPADIVFHGNSKSLAEIEMALNNSIGTIVVDNLSELRLLNFLASEKKMRPVVLFRVTPGVDSHTHAYISTGQLDSKFGFSIEEVIDHAAAMALESDHIEFRGFHFHVGSQLHDNTSHLLAIDKILEMVTVLKEKYGYVPKEINCGGGFGVHYAGDPERPSLSSFLDPMMEKFEAYFRETGDRRPMITIEPGRWIVAEAGITVYEVGSVKTNAAGRTYIGVDGGMADNPRPELYDADYEVRAVEKDDQPYDQIVTVAGKCCESGDILIYDAKLPRLQRGEHIAVLATGAYNYSMASNYNRLPRPAVVMIRDGKPRLSVRRETFEDLIEREL